MKKVVSVASKSREFRSVVFTLSKTNKSGSNQTSRIFSSLNENGTIKGIYRFINAYQKETGVDIQTFKVVETRRSASKQRSYIYNLINEMDDKLATEVNMRCPGDSLAGLKLILSKFYKK